jgi:hypothetical protein
VDEVREGLYVDFNELVVSGREEKKSSRESRAICADECQSTMGQMREGIETKIKSNRQRFYKTPHEENRCGESRTRRDASILSDTSQLRHLGRPVTDSSVSFAPLVLLESQYSPLFISLSTSNSCFANTFETYPYGELRPIRHKHPLSPSPPAHNKSSCLGRHDVTARQKRGHRPAHSVNLGCAVLRIHAVNRRAAPRKDNDHRG